MGLKIAQIAVPFLALISEPASILLLGLGAVMAGRNQKA